MFRNIIVAIDTVEPSSWAKALPSAIELAKAHDGRLTLATIVPNAEATVQAEWSVIAFRKLVDAAHTHLLALTDQYPEARGATIEVGAGNVWRGIIGIAAAADADLIVLASHRPGMKDYLIGANAVHVVRHAPCSVLVIRD